MDHWTMDVQHPHLKGRTDLPQDVVFRPGEESTSMWGSSKWWGLGNGTALKGGRFVGMRGSHGFLVGTYTDML